MTIHGQKRQLAMHRDLNVLGWHFFKSTGVYEDLDSQAMTVTLFQTMPSKLAFHRGLICKST